MGDLKLFRVEKGKVGEMHGRSVSLEKSLQGLMEQNLEALLGVRFLATEHSTGKTHAGRIDTLGLDEDNCPVIIEYKRSVNTAVINQGLFYLDWLLDHKADFTLLVMSRLGKEIAEEIDWGTPRLICVAGDYSRYDQYAVQQIARNIDLIRYRQFEGDLLLLDLVNSVSVEEAPDGAAAKSPAKKRTQKGESGTVSRALENAHPELLRLYESLKDYILSMGDDVHVKTLKLYVAFKRIKNFVCVEVHPAPAYLKLFLKLDPESVSLEEGFSRDVSKIGHWGILATASG